MVKKNITPRKRAIIVQYVKDNVSQSEICKKLDLSKSCVSKIVKRFRETGSSEAGKSTGRPRVSTKREDNRIRRSAVANPTWSSSRIQAETGTEASCRTIRRRLSNEFKLRARRPANKPLLNKKQRAKRVAFCRKYLNWTAQQWNSVMFSDEATFCQFGSVTHFVRRPVGHRFDCRYTTPSMKHPQKIMVWGCFSASGRGSLYFVDQNKTVNGEEYVKILDSKLVLSMLLNKCTVFQQDCAPAHTSRLAKEWFTRNGVQVLEWPGNSPDLNPIENAWTVLKRRVRNHHPANMQQLIYFIKKVWCTEISETFCKKLVESMPRRLQSVIRNKGFATKY
jgi:transposase